MNIYTGTTTTPRMVGVLNSGTYWVSGSNISPITRTRFVQVQRPNEFHSTSIIAKNCTKVLTEEKKLYLDKTKSKINIMSWIDCIRSYMETTDLTPSSMSTIQI